MVKLDMAGRGEKLKQGLVEGRDDRDKEVKTMRRWRKAVPGYSVEEIPQNMVTSIKSSPYV